MIADVPPLFCYTVEHENDAVCAGSTWSRSPGYTSDDPSTWPPRCVRVYGVNCDGR